MVVAVALWIFPAGTKNASPAFTVRAGAPSISQAQINRLLIERAVEGKIVARLKGGDPFIFGRGGEEAEAFGRSRH